MPSRRFTPCALVNPMFICEPWGPACVETGAEGLVGRTFSLLDDRDKWENRVAGKILECGVATLVQSLASCEVLKDVT